MLKRVVIVADNPLIVAAIRSGVRETGALELVGYADPREATAHRIKEAGADVVLVDEGDHAEVALELIRSLRELGPAIKVLALTIDMRGDGSDAHSSPGPAVRCPSRFTPRRSRH